MRDCMLQCFKEELDGRLEADDGAKCGDGYVMEEGGRCLPVT